MGKEQLRLGILAVNDAAGRHPEEHVPHAVTEHHALVQKLEGAVVLHVVGHLAVRVLPAPVAPSPYAGAAVQAVRVQGGIVRPHDVVEQGLGQPQRTAVDVDISARRRISGGARGVD